MIQTIYFEGMINMSWWDSLSNLQQILFVLATSATVVMIIFLILMLIGGDGADSFEGDVDVDGDISGGDLFNDEPLSAFSGLRILSIRGVLAFIAVGAWTAYGFVGFLTPWLSIALGVIAGIIAAYLLAVAFRASLKLESTGNIDYHNAIGKSGNVYIKVPKLHSGIGKVTLTLQERFIEVDAITHEDIDLLTGTAIEVVGLENETTLIVKKK
jgi:membrane protein implicated in regulation of membrane protease activity